MNEMIKKESEKRILQEICINELAPILEKYQFKFIKSKSCFLRKGNELDIILSIYNLSHPLTINEADQLNFNFVIRSGHQLTKFDSWYKKQFTKNNNNFTNIKSKSYNLQSPISFDNFTQLDFFEPSAAREFKSKMTNSLKPQLNTQELYLIPQFETIFIQEIIREYLEIDSIKDLLEFEKLPKLLKCDLLYYSGDINNSKNLYVEFYNEINDQLCSAELPYLISHLSKLVSEIQIKYEVLFKDKLNQESSKIKVEINTSNLNELIIDNNTFSPIGSFTKIIPPINYYSNLAQDHKRGVHFDQNSILLYHDQNLLSKWNLNLSLIGETVYNHTNKEFDIDVVKNIPSDSYESAICETKDGKFLFAGGYHTKSYLIDLISKDRSVLWAHETFKDKYKDEYQVSHNFGVNQAKFILNEKYLLTCACHAKNVIWDIKTLERRELELPFEFTFKGAPPATEFANDVKQICVMDSLELFGILIRDHVLIFDKSFQIKGIINDVKQIRFDNFSNILVIIRLNNYIEVYKRNM